MASIARICLCLVLAMATPACIGRPREPVPRPVSRYLEALRRSDLATAYELTQLGSLSRSLPGGLLTRRHFEALYRANPIRRYAIDEVTRLQIRDSTTGTSSPYFEVNVTLVSPAGTRKAVLSVVEPGIVQVEPIRVLVRPARPVATVVLDGIEGTVRSGPSGALTMLVIDGPHELQVGDDRVRFDTSPVRVIDGDATLEGTPPALTFGRPDEPST